MIVHDGFDAAAAMRAAAEGATAVSLVATALQRIDPSVFRVIVLGGARPPADRPANAVTTYGMTETGSGVVYDGRPLDGVEVRIDDAGEIHLRGPMLLRGYRGRHAPPSPVDGDGWLATGDLGRWLPDGRLHVDGRRGELIITGGENVWPEPVEGVLRGLPGVADVVVAGRPDAGVGRARRRLDRARRDAADARRGPRPRARQPAGVRRAARAAPRRDDPAHRAGQARPPPAHAVTAGDRSGAPATPRRARRPRRR